MDAYQAYIAIGDSMSIDFYAIHDAAANGHKCRDEIGAASLFFQNESTLFPEFAGKDLQTRFPGIKHHNLCIDGDTSNDVLANQHLEKLSKACCGKVLITLTIGGNDLLLAFRKSMTEGSSALTSGLEQLQKRYIEIIDKLQKLFPKATLITTSVYDPTDGTGILPVASSLYTGKLPVQYLEQFNQFVETTAVKRKLLFADVHKHFTGHGALCGSKQNFWYWPPSPIEPGYIGSSEIRRLWLKAVDSLP